MRAFVKILFRTVGFFLVLNAVYCIDYKQWIQWEDTYAINRVAAHDIRNLWPNATVYYKIDENSKDDLGPLVTQAMRMIESQTCLRFIEWNEQSPDYILIQKNSKCSSKLGKQGGKQNLFLSNYCRTIGEVLHELLHTLGFWHEMNRNDRDDYIEIHWNRIKPGEEFNFRKLLPWEHNLLDTPFDYESVMMYGPAAFSLYRNQPTITPKKPGVVLKDVREKQLSSIDVTRIIRLYECFNVKRPLVPDPPKYSCDFEDGDCDILIELKDEVASWIKVKGPMGTLQGDHTTGTGYYYTVNAKDAEGKQAIMYLPEFPKHGRSVGCLSFFYHFRGAGTRTIIGILQTINDASILFSLDPTDANKWKRASINVDLNKNNFRVVLLAISSPTDISGGIFAVDDISFEWNPCK